MDKAEMSENTLRPARKEINAVGFATLGRFLIGMALAYAAYLAVWAAAGAPQIIVMHGGLVDIAATASKLKSNAMHITLLYPMLLLFVTLIANLLPFSICAKRLGLNVKSLFKKPEVSGGTILVFTVVALGASMILSFIMNSAVAILKMYRIHLQTPSFSIPLKSPLGACAMILAIVVVAPITEEFIFRGIVLNTFKKYGSAFAVVCSSLLWALMHGNLVQAVPVFFIGLIFGVLALRAKSIIPTIVIHMINNLIGVLGTISRGFSGSPLNTVIAFFAGLLVLMLIAAAITLFCVYHRQFFIDKNETPETAQKHAGVRAFFTSWIVILTIIIYGALIISSIKPS